MVDFGSDVVYGFFFFAAVGILAAPLTVATLVLEALGHRAARALGYSLVAACGVGSVVAVAAFGSEAGLIPVALGVPFLLVPLTIAVAVLRFAAVDGDHAAHAAVLSFPVAAFLALLSWPLVSLVDVTSRAPALFGVSGFAGYLAYLVGVGVATTGVAAVGRRVAPHWFAQERF